MKITRRLFIAISALLAGLSLSANAATVLPLNIQSLHQQAEVVFLAEAVANRVEQEASTGLVVTYTTFNVVESLKGDVKRSHTIKQIGGKLAGDQAGLKIPGVPAFRRGERYVVFLPKASKIGFSSPVGLSQGQFTLSKVGDVEMVGNGRDFAELMDGMPVTSMPASVKAAMDAMPEKAAVNALRRSTMSLSNFMQLIKSMDK